MHFKFFILLLFCFGTTQAQYADYTDMIRRESRDIQEYISRRNNTNNSPRFSSSVLYDYKSEKDAEKERAKREREQKNIEVQAFLKQQEKLEKEQREKWEKYREVEESVYRATAHKAISYVAENGIPMSTAERDTYIKFELMSNGVLKPNYEQKMTELLALIEVEKTINTAGLDELLSKILKLSSLEGLNANQNLEYVFQLQKRFPQEEIKIDNAFITLFVNFYNSRNDSKILFGNYDKYYDLYQYLDQKYPETVLMLMKGLIEGNYNPIEHGNIIFKRDNEKASSKEWEKRHKKNDEKIKDIKFGLIGYSEKSKTLEGILELCDRYGLEPMEVVLLDDFKVLNSGGKGTIYSTYYTSFDKNNPKFKFFKPLAALCDKNSIRAYMFYLDELGYTDSSKNKILDYANSMLEKGCNTAFTLYFIDHLPSYYVGAENALKSMKHFKETASPEEFKSVTDEIFKQNRIFDSDSKFYNKIQENLVNQLKQLVL